MNMQTHTHAEQMPLKPGSPSREIGRMRLQPRKSFAEASPKPCHKPCQSHAKCLATSPAKALPKPCHIEMLWLKRVQGPRFTGMCVKHRGIRFRRMRDFEKYCFSGMPPTPQSHCAIGGPSRWTSEFHP